MQKKEAIVDKLINFNFYPEKQRDRLMKSRKSSLLRILEEELAKRDKTVDDCYIEDIDEKIQTEIKIKPRDLGLSDKNKKDVNARLTKLRKLQAKKITEEQVKQVLEAINLIY